MLRASVVLRQAAVDWSGLLNIANPQWRIQLINLKRQQDELSNKLATLPKEPPTIDWERYRKVVADPTIIDELRAGFEQNKVPSADPSQFVKTIETEQLETAARAQDYISYVQQELGKLKAELTKIENSKSLEDLTVQDVFDQNPELEAQTVEKRRNFDY